LSRVEAGLSVFKIPLNLTAIWPKFY